MPYSVKIFLLLYSSKDLWPASRAPAMIVSTDFIINNSFSMKIAELKIGLCFTLEPQHLPGFIGAGNLEAQFLYNVAYFGDQAGVAF